MVRPIVTNKLLQLLASADRERVLRDCVETKLTLGEALFHAGDTLKHVYFPTTGFVSLITEIDTHSALEVGMVGSEGVCGLEAILGAQVASLHGIVQGAGSALRIDSERLRRQLEDHPTLRATMNSYISVIIRQLAQTAACTRYHTVDQRLARWLLMTRDRTHCDTFAITQEFLAFMLGVRRAGVTAAAGFLQGRNVISYSRGRLTILEGDELEASSCKCYRSDLVTYANALPA